MATKKPVSVPAASSEEVVEATPINDLPIPHSIRRQLLDDCAEVRKLSIEIKERELLKDAAMDRVKALSATHNLSKVTGPGWLLLKSQGGKKEVDPKRLLERGVSMDVVEYATVKRTWEYYQVRAAKE